MRYIGVLAVLFGSMMPLIGVFAVENTQIIDEMQKVTDAGIKLNDLQFQTFSSCDEMSETLTHFVKENFDQWRGGLMPYARGEEMLMMDTTSSADFASNDAGSSHSKSIPAPTTSTSVGFSTTNNQIAGVDEPEILKSDGDYLYYYNARLQKVFVVKSPLNRTTKIIDMSVSHIVSIIAIPSTFSQVQLFVRPNQLVLLAQRRSDRIAQGVLNTNSKTEIITYDMRDKKTPRLTKFADLDGRYQDARMIDDVLYIVSQVGINRGWYGQTYSVDDEVKVDAETLMPKVINISYTKDTTKKNLTINKKLYPYTVAVHRSDCNETMYVLPSKESIRQYGLTPQFTLLRAVDLSTPDAEIQTSTAFGSTQTIHLNEKSVYLVNPFRAPYNSTCPAGARCIWGGGGDQQTLVHKLALNGLQMDYVNSALLPGSPLTQWSMDEDNKGDFRILTTTRSPQLATHLITLDPNMNKLGSIMNIEPGEQFKAARFMGDKLYLVTFEQIDPLFVIDLATPAAPKIIGELKIPGYSTYLHPYAEASNGVQWLLGLGYDSTTTQRGGTVNNGVKIDLYKIDYTKKDGSGNIAVTQEVTKTFGGKGSESEALQNPRLFVWNPTTKQLVLPLLLTDVQKGKNCTTQYDQQGIIIGETCQDQDIVKTVFAGMKAIEVLPTAITEKASYDYTDLLKQDTQVYGAYDGQIRPRQLSNLQFRVGYLGDVLYAVNNLFAHFVVPTQTGQEIFIPFDSSIVVK